MEELKVLRLAKWTSTETLEGWDSYRLGYHFLANSIYIPVTSEFLKHHNVDVSLWFITFNNDVSNIEANKTKEQFLKDFQETTSEKFDGDDWAITHVITIEEYKNILKEKKETLQKELKHIDKQINLL